MDIKIRNDGEKNMKIKKRNIFLAVLTVVAIAATGITVDAVVTKTPQPPQQTSFIAEITFQLWEDEYTVLIDAEGYQNIKFEFLTVDDQYFAFHLSKIDESSKEIKITSIVSNIKEEILEEEWR
jgi:hypothetical protein